MDKKMEKHGKLYCLEIVGKYKICIESYCEAINILSDKFETLHAANILKDVNFKNMENMFYNKFVEVIKEFNKRDVDFIFFYDEENNQYYYSNFLKDLFANYQAIVCEAIDLLEHIKNYLADNVREIKRISRIRRLERFKSDLFGKVYIPSNDNSEVLENIRKLYCEYQSLMQYFFTSSFAKIYVDYTSKRLESRFGKKDDIQDNQILSNMSLVQDSVKEDLSLPELKKRVLDLYNIDMDFLCLFNQEEYVDILMETYKEFLRGNGVEDIDILKRNEKKYFTEKQDIDFDFVSYLTKSSSEILMNIFFISLPNTFDEGPNGNADLYLRHK